MRVSVSSEVLAALSAMAVLGLTGCKSNGGTGGGGTNQTTSSSSTSASGSTSNASSSSGGPTCTPGAACTAADKTCIGLVDNAGKTKFGLRISAIDMTA